MYYSILYPYFTIFLTKYCLYLYHFFRFLSFIERNYLSCHDCGFSRIHVHDTVYATVCLKVCDISFFAVPTMFLISKIVRGRRLLQELQAEAAKKEAEEAAAAAAATSTTPTRRSTQYGRSGKASITGLQVMNMF